MAEARRRDEWGRLSSLLAHLANIASGARWTRKMLPEDFNFCATKRFSGKSGAGGGMTVTGRNVRVLKQVFVDQKTK